MIRTKIVAVPKGSATSVLNYKSNNGSSSISPSTGTGSSSSGDSTKDCLWQTGDGDSSIMSKGSDDLTSNMLEVAVGQYNKTTKDKTSFSVGNGTNTTNRSNAFEVQNDGTAIATTFQSGSVNTTTINSATINNSGTLKTTDANVDNDLTVGNSVTAKTVNADVGNIKDIYSDNITNKKMVKTKDLTVTGTAHLFELVIDKVKSAGGGAIFTPVDGFDIDLVEAVENGYKLYWRCEVNGKVRQNMWKVNDQAICMSFNQGEINVNYSESNKYYWSLVTAVNDYANPVTREDGNKYNWITISTTTFDGTVNPEVGDSIAMLGYRGTDDEARQSAIYITAYDSFDKGVEAPFIAQYKGIKDFDIEKYRTSWWSLKTNKFVGDFVIESTGENLIEFIDNKIKNSEASIKLDTKNIVLSVSEKTNERRNLLVGSDFKKQNNNFSISDNARIEMNSGYNGTNCIKVIDDTDGTSHYIGAYWDGSQGGRSIKIEKGKKYTISCYYKTNDTNAKFSLEAIYTDKETNAKRLGRPTYLSPNNFTPKYNEWELFTTVIDTTNAESDYIAFNFWEYCNSESGRIEAYICRPMVENGDTYYGWTLSTKDDEYIGANLIDNSRTFEVGGNTLEANGTKTLKGDVYELMYEGSAEYNTFYRIDTTNFKLDTDYTLSFECKGNAKYIGVHAYYPITKTPYILLSEAIGSIMGEQNGDGTSEAYTTLLANSDIERNNNLWVHFKFKKRLPSYIYFQFPKNADQSDVTSWNVTIAKPKIEEGANVTQWTEKKTDVGNSITTITNNVATLTEKANSIEGNVTSNTTKINNINGQVTTNKTDIANLTIKADGIESTVSSLTKSYGTNLFSFTNTKFQDYHCRSAIQMNGFFTNKLNQGIYRLQNFGTNGEGGDFVVSFDARVLKNTTVNVNFCDVNAEENNGDIELTTAFQHYILHFNNVQSDFLNIDPYNGFIDFEPKTQDETNQLYVANFMLERGNVPSNNFSLSDADRNNYGNKESFNTWETYQPVTVVDESINERYVKAYKIEGVPSGETFVDILKGNNLQEKMKIQPQKVYTLSFYAKASEKGHGIETYLYPNINDSGVQDIQYQDTKGPGTQTAYSSKSDGYTLCELDTTWRKFYVHWHPHTVGDIYNCVCGRLHYNMTVWLSDVKLEEGYICEENISNQETYTAIQQTADEILIKANNTYIKVGDAIILNGDTKINGSLTINDANNGFILQGPDGTTEIKPKSIGTYEDFKNTASIVINTNYSRNVNGIYKGTSSNSSMEYEYQYEETYNWGNRKKDDYISLNDFSFIQKTLNNIGESSNYGNYGYSLNYEILENGTVKKQGTLKDVKSLTYTVTADSEVTFYIKYHLTDLSTAYNPSTTRAYRLPIIVLQFKWNTSVPNSGIHTIIGQDGWASNFGNNTTVYCGKDGFIANYGDSLFKITTDGIIERRNGASIATVKGSTIPAAPLNYSLPQDIDTVLCISGHTRVILPKNPYQGQRVKIYDKSPDGETYIRFQGYMVKSDKTYNDRSYEMSFQCDGNTVRIFTFIGDTWYEEYVG